MYSFMQAELSDIRVVLQKVSGSQIARGVSSEMVVRLFLVVYMASCSGTSTQAQNPGSG